MTRLLEHRAPLTPSAAERLVGTDGSGVQVAMAPTPLVVASATDGVAHPVVAALDLSTSARGREILGDWGSIDLALAGAEVVWQ